MPLKWGFLTPGQATGILIFGAGMTLYFICQRLKQATSAAPENEDPPVNPAESPLESLDEVMDERSTLWKWSAHLPRLDWMPGYTISFPSGREA